MPDGGRGVDDMLTLAGVCMMGVMTHGRIFEPPAVDALLRIALETP